MQNSSSWETYIDKLLRAKLDWEEEVPCRKVGPRKMYPASNNQQAIVAKEVCSGCHARVPCLELALATSEYFGVWGGTTEKDRQSVIRSLSTMADDERHERIVAMMSGFSKGQTGEGKTVSA